MGMKPFAESWSWAVEESLFAKALGGTVVSVVESSSGNGVVMDAVSAVRFVPPEPGCFTIPKFLWTLEKGVDGGWGE
jgi:hypothetical protein